MTEWERVTESLENLSDALYRFGEALVDWGIAAVKTFVESIGIENIEKAAAYTKAKKEHPEWVHKAIYCKKKRIRKKYHDRIMRQYWRTKDVSD